MAQNNSGFLDADGVSATDLLARIGPTLKVGLGFDPDFDPKHASRTPRLPVDGLWALIDTGASVCCIDSTLAMHLELPLVDKGYCDGISGLIEVDMYLAQIHVPNLQFTLYGKFAGVDLGRGDHRVLLGRDFLRHFVMTYDGPSRAVFLVDPQQPLPPPDDEL